MAGIKRNLELYILAYKLAWKYISEDHKREQPNKARHLHGSIERLLKQGGTDAVFIASEALKDIERTSAIPF
jgi:hypothetical protein